MRIHPVRILEQVHCEVSRVDKKNGMLDIYVLEVV